MHAALSFLLFAAAHTGSGHAENAAVALEAAIYADADSVKTAVGDDLGNHYIVVRIKLVPKSGPVPIQLDDFLLKTDKDGERSHPFSPSQIAGQGVMVIRQVADGGGRGQAQPNRPTFGGIGFPSSGGSMGTTASTTGAEAKMQQEEKENPLLKTLTEKILREQQASEPVSGLLYFPMEKQRLKDLELAYTTSAGKLTVRFRP